MPQKGSKSNQVCPLRSDSHDSRREGECHHFSSSESLGNAVVNFLLARSFHKNEACDHRLRFDKVAVVVLKMKVQGIKFFENVSEVGDVVLDGTQFLAMAQLADFKN